MDWFVVQTFLLTNPRVLYAEDVILFTWLFQVRSLLKVAPRYFADLTASRTSTCPCTVMILSFWTDRSGQTVQTQIREEQSDQGLHCLPFCLHLLDALLYGKATLFKF